MKRSHTDKPLHLTLDRIGDFLLAIEFGEICDGRPDSEYLPMTDDVAWVLREAGGEVIGLSVSGLDGFDPEEIEELWSGPRFDVPVLGLSDALGGEIVLSALATFADTSTTDARAFQAAVQHDSGPEKLDAWRVCLGTGDLRAHFALGYTLCEQGHLREAYRHLRHYTELAPHNAWAWNWLGQACVGAGELSEAQKAFERAIQLEAAGSFETDAAERLAELSG